MKSLEEVMQMATDEATRIEKSPEELARIEAFTKTIGNQTKNVYAKLTRKTWHDFIQCCKHEGVTVGEKLTALCEEYASSNFDGKKEYDPEIDWKSLQSRSHV